MADFIEYKSLDKRLYGRKYQLKQHVTLQLGHAFVGLGTINRPFFTLDDTGVLFITEGYTWDGASGALDTADFMYGSMVHDALCDLMADGALPKSLWNAAAVEMFLLNRKCGMGVVRAAYTFTAVALWGRLKRYLDAKIPETLKKWLP